jgi:hypothetical protein
MWGDKPHNVIEAVSAGIDSGDWSSDASLSDSEGGPLLDHG